MSRSQHHGPRSSHRFRRDWSPPALALLGTATAKAPAALELQLYPHLALADGRSGNNGWLHEFPDPITRITWGGALSIAPRRFDEMKLANGDLVEIDAGHAKLEPALRALGCGAGSPWGEPPPIK